MLSFCSVDAGHIVCLQHIVQQAERAPVKLPGNGLTNLKVAVLYFGANNCLVAYAVHVLVQKPLPHCSCSAYICAQIIAE